MAGYFFYLIFTFDNITSYLFFVALLAFIAVRAHEATPPLFATSSLPPRMLPAAAGGAIILACLTAWFVNADAIAQNRLIIRGLSTHASGVKENLAAFKEAVAYRSVGDQEAREQFSQAATSIIRVQEQPLEMKEEFLRTALTSMGELAAEAPHNARFPFFMGILLDQAGAYEDARAALGKAHELSPGKQSILIEYGLNAFARGENDEAVGYFKQAYDLAPKFHEAEVFYAAALVRAGKDAEADALIARMIEADTAADARIASAYAVRNKYDTIAAIWSAHIEKKPDDVEARFVLASTYYAAGNTMKALQELEAIKREVPGAAAQADSFIDMRRLNEAELHSEMPYTRGVSDARCEPKKIASAALPRFSFLEKCITNAFKQPAGRRRHSRITL